MTVQQNCKDRGIAITEKDGRLTELAYRRELHRRGSRNVSPREWNDWEWYATKRVTVDPAVPLTDGLIGDIVAGFLDQLE